MEYVIFLLIVIAFLWVYHRINYVGSTYGRFEYYLTGELHPIIATIIFLFEKAIMFVGICAIIYGGGQLIKLIL